MVVHQRDTPGEFIFAVRMVFWCLGVKYLQGIVQEFGYVVDIVGDRDSILEFAILVIRVTARGWNAGILFLELDLDGLG